MITIGCRNLDLLIGGGIPDGLITQVYGTAGSGKTNIALCCAYNAVKTGKKVLFVDTEGSFNEQRVKQIFGADKNLIKNIILVEVSDFNEQKNAIEKILDKKTDIIIVDSMTSLYRVEKNDDNYSDINRELGKLASILLAKARKNMIPVLITNQVYSNLDKQEDEPVGGDILKYYSKVIISLEKDTDSRKAKLRKHAFKKDNDETNFIIVEKGLRDI